MQSSITVRSWGATVLGLLFAGITARVLLDDVVNGAPIGITHMMSIGALVATLASGHYLIPAIRRGGVLTAFGLAILFVAGTGYCVVASAARNAEVAANKAAKIRQDNEKRTALRAKLVQAEADLEAAKTDLNQAAADAARECGTGKGKRCEGREATRAAAERARDRADSHVLLILTEIEMLGPAKSESGGYAKAGEVYAVLTGGSAERATIAIQLAMPIVTTLLCELGTIVFLSIGLGHVQRAATVAPPVIVAPANDDSPRRRRRRSRAEVVEFVKLYEQKNGRPPTWLDVRSAGFSGATASRGMKAAVAGSN